MSLKVNGANRVNLLCLRVEHINLRRFWEGGESLLAQARGGKSEHHRARCRVTLIRSGIHAGRRFQDRLTDSATEKIPPRSATIWVRVKRWGKSPPREAQATRHGKPHWVQGQIGDLEAARFAAGQPAGSRVWLLRQMILSARKGADKIRLTALPKPFASSVPCP